MAKISKPTSMSSQERQWEIEDALRTLQRADKIRKDSKLMGEVQKSLSNTYKMAFGGTISKAPSKPSPSKKK